MMSSSISSTETSSQSKLDPSKYLPDINNESDLFAIILHCTVTATDTTTNSTTLSSATSTTTSSASTTTDEQSWNLKKFKELLITDSASLSNSTFMNLLRYSIQLKRPLLTVFATMISNQHLEYSWFVWLSLKTKYDIKKCANDDLDFYNMSLNLIEHCIKNGCLLEFSDSVEIFYGTNDFKLLSRYLANTAQFNFSDETTTLLQAFIIALSGNACTIEFIGPVNMVNFTMKLLALHVKHSFDSREHRSKLLQSLCDSKVNDISDFIDFRLIKSIEDIIQFTEVEINLEPFMQDQTTEVRIKQEQVRICDSLLSEKYFNKALAVAEIFSLPIDNIIYENWIHSYDLDDEFDLRKCETEIDFYLLSPELLINFYIYVANKIPYENCKKYEILKMILNVVKKHNLYLNENFNYDSIEHEMTLSFLKNEQTIENISIYNSEYFENIMAYERYVLYKSFLELKEVAGIEDLTVNNKMELTETETRKLDDLMNKHLDDGDIVQAFRIQVSKIFLCF